MHSNNNIYIIYVTVLSPAIYYTQLSHPCKSQTTVQPTWTYISRTSTRDCKVCYILSWPWVSATTQLVVTFAGKNSSHSSGIWPTDPGDIDLYKFREDLSQAPWSVMNSFNSTNYKTFLQVLNDHAPLQLPTLHIMEQSPSVTRDLDIQDQMDIRDKSFWWFRATRSADDWEGYRGLCYRVTILLWASKRAHVSCLIYFC